MRTLLLLPDGVGVRNFLLGPFPRHATEHGDVVALHTMPDGLAGIYRSRVGARVLWERFAPQRDTPVSFTLRNALAYAQIYLVDTQAIRYQRSLPLRGSRRRRAAGGLARLCGRALASPRGIRLLDRLHRTAVRQQPEVEYYAALFRRIRPSVLFSSHQRPPVILPAVLAAKSLGIPTATFIFSWDNLTSKGRIAAPFDHYLVWSRHMHDELRRYYPEVPSERIHIVGTPQFDPYADGRVYRPRDEFLRRIGADPSRRVILYSSNDASTGPEDPDHVAVLLDLIRDGSIRGNPQVVLRPHPADMLATGSGGGRFETVRRRYPELIVARPAWVHADPNDWAGALPLPEDVPYLANLARHVDLNVNVASTMTIDFALHDKPIVNIAFDVAEPPPFGVPLWNFAYRFEHYRPVVDLGAARFARSRVELAEHVNAYLDDPALDRDGRRRLVELQTNVPMGESSQRIVEVLERIAR